MKTFKLIGSVAILATSVVTMVSCAPSSDQAQRSAEQTPTVELNVLAAASLSDALKEIDTRYESTHPGVKILPVFAASGTLQRQIEQGAPADLFISAAETQMNFLKKENLIDMQHESNLLSNELVLIVPTNSTKIKSFSELIQANKVALGEPVTVPAGTYARESLQKSDLWNSLQAKIVYGKDVRQVLTYVETGNVDAGIVYKTDAETSKNVKIVETIDSNSHAPIVYPFSIVKGTQHLKDAEDFYKWLSGPESMEVFKKYGFDTPKS